MIPRRRIPVHPGEVLAEHLAGLDLSALALANALKIHHDRIGAVIRGERPIRAWLAWKLSRELGTTPEYWMNLQVQHDLGKARPR